MPETTLQTEVAIVGGFAGVELALKLDGRVPFVLIEPREAFVRYPAMLRAMVEPDLGQLENSENFGR